MSCGLDLTVNPSCGKIISLKPIHYVNDQVSAHEPSLQSFLHYISKAIQEQLC